MQQCRAPLCIKRSLAFPPTEAEPQASVQPHSSSRPQISFLASLDLKTTLLVLLEDTDMENNNVTTEGSGFSCGGWRKAVATGSGHGELGLLDFWPSRMEPEMLLFCLADAQACSP